MTAAGPVGGNALDVALWSAPEARSRRAGDGPSGYQRLGLLPFDHERQMASVASRTPTATTLLVTKGAPEAVMARCVDVPAAGRTTTLAAALRRRRRGSSPSPPATAPGLVAAHAGRRT